MPHEEQHEHDFDDGLDRTRFVGALLDIGGWFVIVTLLGWAFYRFWVIAQTPAPDALNEFLTTLVKLIAGLAGAVLLWGLAEMMRRMDEFQYLLENTLSVEREMLSGRPPHRTQSINAPPNVEQNTELADLLREVRDISLLSDEQRKLRLDAQGQAELAMLQREVPVLLAEHNWIDARNRVQEARERFPTLKDWNEMAQRVEKMRTQVEAHDIADAERQIADLAALSAWDRVAEVVNELIERHPDCEEAIELAHKTRTQRHEAESKQRAQLMARAQEAVNAREWQTAVDHANAIIQRYAKSTEAQALRMQLPMLRENAEIKLRQTMEKQFRDLSQQHRYDQALRVARTVVDHYPSSPQAAALREQLPKLESLARAKAGRG